MYDRGVYLAKLREMRDRYYAGEELSEKELRCLLPFIQGKVMSLTECLRISSVREALGELISEAQVKRGKYSVVR